MSKSNIFQILTDYIYEKNKFYVWKTRAMHISCTVHLMFKMKMFKLFMYFLKFQCWNSILTIIFKITWKLIANYILCMSDFLWVRKEIISAISQNCLMKLCGILANLKFKNFLKYVVPKKWLELVGFRIWKHLIRMQKKAQKHDHICQ